MTIFAVTFGIFATVFAKTKKSDSETNFLKLPGNMPISGFRDIDVGIFVSTLLVRSRSVLTLLGKSNTDTGHLLVLATPQWR